MSEIVDSSASRRRPQRATSIPRRAASIARARPIPEPAPVMRTRFFLCGMFEFRPRAEVVEDPAVESIKYLGVLDNDLLRLRIIETVHEFAEKRDVFHVQRPVRAQI